MQTELPAERLQRRLGAESESDAGDNAEPDTALSRWLPDTAKSDGAAGWLAAIRADPGRAGVIALAAVGIIAVLATTAVAWPIAHIANIGWLAVLVNAALVAAFGAAALRAVEPASEVAPVAEKLGLRLCCHPDDPPFSLLGLPRIMSTEADYASVMSAVDTPANGSSLRSARRSTAIACASAPGKSARALRDWIPMRCPSTS